MIKTVSEFVYYQSCICAFHFLNVASDFLMSHWIYSFKNGQNNYTSNQFLAKTIPDNADMPCQRLIYKYRDFKIESLQKLWKHKVYHHKIFDILGYNFWNR